MNRAHFTRATFAVIVIALITVPVLVYNDLIRKEEAVEESWSQVESTYQRRANLIPNLQKTVKRFLEHERETLAAVTAAREGGAAALESELAALKAAREDAAGAGSPSDDGAPTSKESLLALDRGQRQLGQRMRALIGRVEAYPQLRSSDQFLRLQSQLEGTENRIDIARQRYNEAVSAYNSSLRGIPGRWLADAMGLESRPYFEADAGANETPEVEF